MPWHPDADTPVRLLARSLLYEYIARSAAEWRRDSPPAPVPIHTRRVTGQTRPLRWPRGAVIQAIQAFTQREGRVPTRQDWRTATHHHLPGYATVIAQFGSLDAAYEAAGEQAPAVVPQAERPALRRRWKQ